jgi:hypothetical protein
VKISSRSRSVGDSRMAPVHHTATRVERGQDRYRVSDPPFRLSL